MTKTIYFAAAGLLMIAATAAAQTTTTTPPASPSASPGPGSYDRLSVGNQKIALALFKAQVEPTPAPPGATPGATPSPTPLTLDQIAGLKQSGTGWGQVFKQMKAQGLVTQKNLGQVVSKFNHASHSSGGAVTAANRAADKAVTSGDDGGRGSDLGNDKSVSSRGHGGALTAGGSASSGQGNAYGKSGLGGGNPGRGNGNVK